MYVNSGITGMRVHRRVCWRILSYQNTGGGELFGTYSELVVNILSNSNITSENTKSLTFYTVALDFDIVHALTVSEIALVRSCSRQLQTQILILTFFLFCTLTNKCTIISQIIITFLHVSTLSCHPQ
jgi:hypothetical protein